MTLHLRQLTWSPLWQVYLCPDCLGRRSETESRRVMQPMVRPRAEAG